MPLLHQQQLLPVSAQLEKAGSLCISRASSGAGGEGGRGSGGWGVGEVRKRVDGQGDSIGKLLRGEQELLQSGG